MAAVLEYEMEMNPGAPAVIAVFGKCAGDLAHCVVSTLFVPRYEVSLSPLLTLEITIMFTDVDVNDTKVRCMDVGSALEQGLEPGKHQIKEAVASIVKQTQGEGLVIFQGCHTLRGGQSRLLDSVLEAFNGRRSIMIHDGEQLSLVNMVFLLLFETNDVVKDSQPWQSQLLSWWSYQGKDFTPGAAVGRIGHGILLLPPSYCNSMGEYAANLTTCDRISNLDNQKGSVQNVVSIAAAMLLMVLCVAYFLKQWKRWRLIKHSSSQRKMKGKGRDDDVQKLVDVGAKQSRKTNSKAESAISDETKFAETGTSEPSYTTSSPSSPQRRHYNLRRRRSKENIKNVTL